jgi:hypothetical protein
LRKRERCAPRVDKSVLCFTYSTGAVVRRLSLGETLSNQVQKTRRQSLQAPAIEIVRTREEIAWLQGIEIFADKPCLAEHAAVIKYQRRNFARRVVFKYVIGCTPHGHRREFDFERLFQNPHPHDT